MREARVPLVAEDIDAPSARRPPPTAPAAPESRAKPAAADAVADGAAVAIAAIARKAARSPRCTESVAERGRRRGPGVGSTGDTFAAGAKEPREPRAPRQPRGTRSRESRVRRAKSRERQEGRNSTGSPGNGQLRQSSRRQSVQPEAPIAPSFASPVEAPARRNRSSCATCRRSRWRCPPDSRLGAGRDAASMLRAAGQAKSSSSPSRSGFARRARKSRSEPLRDRGNAQGAVNACAVTGRVA